MTHEQPAGYSVPAEASDLIATAIRLGWAVETAWGSSEHLSMPFFTVTFREGQADDAQSYSLTWPGEDCHPYLRTTDHPLVSDVLDYMRANPVY